MPKKDWEIKFFNTIQEQGQYNFRVQKSLEECLKLLNVEQDFGKVDGVAAEKIKLIMANRPFSGFAELSKIPGINKLVVCKVFVKLWNKATLMWGSAEI